MIADLLKLMRLHYSLTLAAGLPVILAYVRAGRFAGVWDRAAWAFASMLCLISGAMVLNDVCDAATDRINHPQRPIAAGRVSRKDASMFAVLLFAAAVVLSVQVTPAFAAGVIPVMAGLIVYDRYSKRLGLLKDLLAAVLAASLYPLAFAIAVPVAGPRLRSLAVFSVWFFLTALAYEMFKDVRDVHGDRAAGGGGLANLSGHPAFLAAARAILIIAAALMPLPWVLGLCKWVYLLFASAAVLLTIPALRGGPLAAIRCVYAQVILITVGSLLDLLIFPERPGL